MHSSIFKHFGPTGISAKGVNIQDGAVSNIIHICTKSTIVSFLYHLLFSDCWALSANALLKTIFSGLMVFLQSNCLSFERVYYATAYRKCFVRKYGGVHADQDLLSVETGYFRSVLIMSFSELAVQPLPPLIRKSLNDYLLIFD